MSIDTEVLVVGAGPAGLALAVALTEKGVPVRILDRAEAGANTSRAAVVHAHTLDILEPLGVTRTLADQGLVVPRFSARDRDRSLITVDFSGLRSRHPYAVMISQSVTEAVLTERLAGLGVTIERQHELIDLTQDAESVTAQVRSASGAASTVRCKYLVGADGMHSQVRQQIGVGFTGERYPQHLALADVRMDWPISRQEGQIFFAPDGLMVIVPLPGDHFRIVGTTTDSAGEVDRSMIQAMVDRRGPSTGSRALVREVVWGSRFSVHHRLADSFRSGRVLLVGDAAHVHSPAGGQGMNLGIADAVELGGLLAAVHDGAAPDVLDRYEQRRRPRAAHVIAFTDRMTRAATTGSRPAQLVRDTVVRLAGAIPAVRQRLARELSGVA